MSLMENCLDSNCSCVNCIITCKQDPLFTNKDVISFKYFKYVGVLHVKISYYAAEMPDTRWEFLWHNYIK